MHTGVRSSCCTRRRLAPAAGAHAQQPRARRGPDRPRRGGRVVRGGARAPARGRRQTFGGTGARESRQRPPARRPRGCGASLLGGGRRRCSIPRSPERAGSRRGSRSRAETAGRAGAAPVRQRRRPTALSRRRRSSRRGRATRLSGRRGSTASRSARRPRRCRTRSPRGRRPRSVPVRRGAAGPCRPTLRRALLVGADPAVAEVPHEQVAREDLKRPARARGPRPRSAARSSCRCSDPSDERAVGRVLVDVARPGAATSSFFAASCLA